MILFPKQKLAIGRPENEILFGGARGPGKTAAGHIWLTSPLKWYPEHSKSYRALVVRRNAEDLSDWLDRARTIYHSWGGRIVGRPPVVKFQCGAEFRTGHLKDDNAFTKYIGHEYARVLAEELTLIKLESQWENLISCNRSITTPIPAKTFSTTNPGGIGHGWVKNRFQIQGKPPYEVKPVKFQFKLPGGKTITRSRVFIHATVDDNPLIEQLDPGYIAYLESIKDPNLKAAWRHGDWSVFAGQFFFLDEHIHGIEQFEIPENWDVWGAIDYGTSNPTSFGIYAKDEITENVYRICEYYQPGLGANHAQNIYDLINACEFININPEQLEIKAPPDMWTPTRLDERRIDTPADIFKSYGLKLKKVSNQDRVNGWRVVKDLLAYKMTPDGYIELQPRFRYFKGYNNALEENLPLQIHSKTNVEDLEKNDTDHVADELRHSFVGAKRRRFQHSGPLKIRGI